MPFYEYQCSSCGHHHEALQKISDKPLRKCPECGRSTLKRLMSAPVFRLKGGGWYETDFKSEKDAKRNLAGDQEPAQGKADAKESEVKPAAEAKPTAEGKAASAAKPAADKPPADKAQDGKPARTSKARKPAAGGSDGKQGTTRAARRRAPRARR